MAIVQRSVRLLSSTHERTSHDAHAPAALLGASKGASVDVHVRFPQTVYRALIDAEAKGMIGADFWERTEGRTAVR